MSRNRLGTLVRSAAVVFFAGCAAIVCSGCVSRRTATRVYLHGETVDEDFHPIPNAVVRLKGRETLSDEKGHYRFLYVARCLAVGAAMEQTSLNEDEIQAYAEGYAPYRLSFGLPAKELLSTANCPKEADKYLRLELSRAPRPQDEHRNEN